MPTEILEKGLGGAILAGALSVGGAIPKQAATPAPIEAKETAKAWTPEGLDPELHPIAHLESNWGKNTKHAVNPKGVFHTAHGAVGLKPVTAHEEYMRSKSLQKEYPNLQDPEKFTALLQQDHVFYNKTASKHWQMLRTKLGSPVASAFAWRWGIGAAQRAPEQHQKEDPYVIKYASMTHTPLTKMAVKDIAPGKKTKQFSWDYSHLLTPENKAAGYGISVSFHPASVHPKLGKLRDRFHGEITHNGKPIGNLSAPLHLNCKHGPCIEPHVTIQDGHHKKGLGTALYEGVFKEANLAGIKSVHAHMQSPAAIRLHTALARKHGFKYKPAVEPGVDPSKKGMESEYPGGETRYLIKSDTLGRQGGNEGTIRQLLVSDNANDWAMAFRLPGALPDEMEFLMDRIGSIAADSPTVGELPPLTVLGMLQSVPFWDKDKFHRAMTLPVFRRLETAEFFIRNPLADGETVDSVLSDIDVWLPKHIDGSRPQLVSLMERDGLTPDQFDKIYSLVDSEGLGWPGWSNKFFNEQGTNSLSPELVSRWLDMATQKRDGELIQNLSGQLSTDKLFEQALALPSELGGLALHGSRGKMTEGQLYLLLTNPATWQNKKGETGLKGEAIRKVVETYLAQNPHTSKYVKESLVRHPNREFVDRLTQAGHLPSDPKPLVKSVESGDFKGIAGAVDPHGGNTVDHKPHLEAHPPSMTGAVNNYRANVLGSPSRIKKQSSKDLGGVSRKVIYSTKSPEGEESKYLVKPYHERVIRRVKDWMKNPIQGWAEMANQGLYHAAGIGDLHQKVHVSEHPMTVKGEKRNEPALVVHMEEGFHPVAEHNPHPERDKDLHEQIMKVGVMDHLTNNVDRHGMNLLLNPETRKVLAIDHSRNFQYKASRKPFKVKEKVKAHGEDDADSLSNYIKGGAVGKMIPSPSWDDEDDGGHQAYMNKWKPTIEQWWPKVSQSVRAEIDKHLEHIKDPAVKEHIHKNFHARADMLDDMAKHGLESFGEEDWHENPVELHQQKKG